MKPAEHGVGFHTPCPVCGGERSRPYRLGLQPPMLRCPDCMLLFRPVDRTRPGEPDQYDESYYDAWGDLEEARRVKLRTFDGYLRLLERHVAPGRLLDVGCATGFLMEAAQARGWEPCGVEVSPFAARRARERFGDAVYAGPLESAPFPAGHFGAVTLTDVLEHLPDPVAALRRCAGLLAPGGCALLTTPRVGGLSERLLGRWWFQYKEEHLQLFTPGALSRALRAAGLELVAATAPRKTLNLTYIARIFAVYRRPVVTPLLAALERVLGPLCRAPFRVPTGEQLVIARKAGSAAGRPAEA